MKLEPINPRTLSDEDRAALLAQVEEELITELPFQAVVFWDKPNKARWRLDAEDFDGFVERSNATCDGATPPQLLYDHGVDGVKSQVGRLTSVEIVEEGGIKGIAVGAVITDHGAMKKFLRRELDRFSIAPNEAVGSVRKCSICGQQTDSLWYLPCGHTFAEGAEVIITPTVLREVSFTLNPAVDDTAVLADPATPVASEPVEVEPEMVEIRIEGIPKLEGVADAFETVAKEKVAAKASAQIDETIARQRDEIERLQLQLFDSEFAQACACGRLLPADRADTLALFESQHRDLEKLRGWISRRPATASVATVPQSQQPIDPSRAEAPIFTGRTIAVARKAGILRLSKQSEIDVTNRINARADSERS